VADPAEAMGVLSVALIPSPAGVELAGTREVHGAFHPAVHSQGDPGTQVPEPTTGGEVLPAAITTGAAELTGQLPGTAAEAVIITGAVPTMGVAATDMAGGFTSATVIPVITAATMIRTTAIRMSIRMPALLTVRTATA
jgi:hypothetical protein